MKLFGIFTITVVSFIFLMSNGIALGANPNTPFFTNGSTAFGTPYHEWIGKFWGWWFGIPDEVHPARDYDSKRCSTMQEGPVWFLYDIQEVGDPPGVHVSCTVPADRGIFLPISLTICERGIEKTENLKICADNIKTPLEQMIVKVDGERIDVANLKGKTGEFNITIPENFYNGFANPVPDPGSYPAYATGYFLLLHDLSPGMHKIELSVKDIIQNIDPSTGVPQNQEFPKRSGYFDILVK